jgi:hypothetical protein
MWKEIEEVDKRYEINEVGEIRNKHTLHILTPKINRYGYHQIGLRKKGDRKKYWFTIHRLVASYFIENKPTNWRELDVDHIDHNKTNNNVENLRFITCQENNLHRQLKPWATNTTGELYITKYRHGYMIRINRNDYKKQEWVSSLEKAIIQRNTYISEFPTS